MHAAQVPPGLDPGLFIIPYAQHAALKNLLQTQFRAAAAGFSITNKILETVWSLPFLRATPAGIGVAASKDLRAAPERFLTHYASDPPEPIFGFDKIRISGDAVTVTEEVLLSTDFYSVRHWKRTDTDGNAVRRNDPKTLIVTPYSGHNDTLLRDTHKKLLPDHDVYWIKWHDAKHVPNNGVDFNLADMTDGIIAATEAVSRHNNPDGPLRNTNIVAVCQPGPIVLAATALMAMEGNPCLPRSVAMMGSPVDTRKNPTEVNRLAQSRPLEWFERNLIHTVPDGKAGAGRQVYPGYLQWSSFISLDVPKYAENVWHYAFDLAACNHAAAAKKEAFDHEFDYMIDLPKGFYLQTIDGIFQRHLIPNGTFTHRGRLVDFGAIKDVGMILMEGAKDTITGVGQTAAAADVARNLPDGRIAYRLFPGAGHYALFSGKHYDQVSGPWLIEQIRKPMPGDIQPYDAPAQQSVRAAATPAEKLVLAA